jgi:hypothetical protein
MSTVLNIKNNPSLLLLLTAIALLIALVFSPIAKIDFQDKKMFNIPLATMLWIFPLLLILFWLLYVLTNRFLYSVTLIRIHVHITVSATILLLAVLYLGIMPSPGTIDENELIGNSMQILSLIFVFAQLFYPANVLLGLFTKNKGTTANKCSV